MTDKNDNLEELLGGFLGEAEAGGAAADIRGGDVLLSEYPAPQPDARLLEEIKVKVGDSLGAAAAARRRVRRGCRRFCGGGIRRTGKGGNER